MKELETQTEEEGFAARWSRRKRQLKSEQDGVQSEHVGAAEPDDAESAALEEQNREQDRAKKLAQLNALSDEDMPDIATLNEDSDFSQFMSTSVSEALRKQALHKLFHGSGYNIRDGLDEYDGDYTYFEKLDPGTITADMKYRIELEAEKLKAKLEAEAKKADEIEENVEDDSDADSPTDERLALEEELDNENEDSLRLEQQASDKHHHFQQENRVDFSQQAESELSREKSDENPQEESP